MVDDTGAGNLGRLARSEAVLRREELGVELLVGLPFANDPGGGRPFEREGFEVARPLVEGKLVVRGWGEGFFAVPVYAGLPAKGVEQPCPIISPFELRVVLLAEPFTWRAFVTLAASPFESSALRLRPDDGGSLGWGDDFSPEISASRSPICEGNMHVSAS